LDGTGGLLVTDSGGATLRRLDLTTRTVTTLLGRHGHAGLGLGAASGLNYPSGVAVFRGRLFLSDAAENVLLTAVPPNG
jgi:hypothetical protein